MDDDRIFTEDEWQALRRVPVLAAALISAVDYSQLSEPKEFKAFAGFVENAAAKRTKSAIISAILNDISSNELDKFQQHCEFVATAMSGENPVDQALTLAKRAGQLVDTRLTAKEAKQYKAFIMDVALVVARAHKESLLPLASSISKVEEFHIRRLSQALGY